MSFENKPGINVFVNLFIVNLNSIYRVSVMCVQLLLHIITYLFETLQTFSTLSEGLYMIWI